MNEYKLKDFASDVCILLCGITIGISLSVKQTGAPVKIGPITIANKDKDKESE